MSSKKFKKDRKNLKIYMIMLKMQIKMQNRLFLSLNRQKNTAKKLENAYVVYFG
jgi:hypothetical protein